MAHDVFISYAGDDKATADAACAVLEQSAIRCWIAPRDILGSQDWGEAIIDAIAGSRLLVLIHSSHANASGQVKREVERAVSKGIAVLPFRIENVPPARSLEYFLSNVHWLDATTPPVERHLGRLVDTVRTLLPKPDFGVAPQALDVGAESAERGQASAGRPAAPERGRRAVGLAARAGIALALTAASVFVLLYADVPFPGWRDTSAPATAPASIREGAETSATTPPVFPTVEYEAVGTPGTAAPDASGGIAMPAPDDSKEHTPAANKVASPPKPKTVGRRRTSVKSARDSPVEPPPHEAVLVAPEDVNPEKPSVQRQERKNPDDAWVVDRGELEGSPATPSHVSDDAAHPSAPNGNGRILSPASGQIPERSGESWEVRR